MRLTGITAARMAALAVVLLVAGCSVEKGAVASSPSSQPTTTAGPAPSISAEPDIPTENTGIALVETTEAVEPLHGLAYEPILTGFDFPIVLIPAPGSEDMLLGQKSGRVYRLSSSGELTEVLDIRERVRNRGEQGFLGMAVDPDDPSRVFLHYSDGSGDTTVSEFQMAPDATIDPASERVLLTARQPAGNHNGGWIQFGPDGALYLGLGDGGGANDEFGNGRNDDTLLAGLVRIDVDSGDATKFAKGLRNPWRFWIEGDLVYVADVGQNAYEEVSVAPLTAGVDYGWSEMEGFHCFPSNRSCDQTGLQPPVVEVEHGDAGTCSITGGVVYRGDDIPELRGHYLYSDYCGGYLRSFRFADGAADEFRDWTDSVGVPGQIVSFGYDGNGNAYALTTTDVLRIVPVR